MELKLDAAKWRRRRGIRRLLKALGAERRPDPLRRRRGPRRSARRCRSATSTSPPGIRPDEVIARLEAARHQGGPDRHRPWHHHRGQRRPAGRSHHACAATSRPTAAARPSPSPTTGRKMRRGATSPSMRSTPIPMTGEIFDYFGGLDDLESAPCPVHRRPAAADRRGPSADPALLPLPRPLRLGRARPASARGLHRARQRPDGLVARTHRRRTVEAARPARPGADRRDHARARQSSKPVLPEIEPARMAARALIAAEREAGIAARSRCGGSPRCCRPIRRWPKDRRPAQAVEQGAQAARLRRGRGPRAQPAGPRLSVGIEWRGRPAAARRGRRYGEAIATWKPPRLPIGGGTLIARGLPEGPTSPARCGGSRIAGSRPASQGRGARADRRRGAGAGGLAPDLRTAVQRSVAQQLG